ncbi:ankyrin repeat-containing domain protein [Aspergillus heterothallicus]
MSSLLRLPIELTVEISKYLCDRDLSHLAVANRFSLSLLEPQLYARGLHYRNDRLPALAWAGKTNNSETVAKVFNYHQADEVLLFTALLEAANAGHVDMAEFLIGCGAPVEPSYEESREFLKRRDNSEPDDSDELSPNLLEVAVYAGYPAMVRLLVQYGARLDYIDGDGDSLLHCATRTPRSRRCIAVLLDAGADAHAAGFRRETPWSSLIHYTRVRPDSAALRLFLEAGADLAAHNAVELCSEAVRIITFGDTASRQLVLEYGMPRIPQVPASELLLAAAAVGDDGCTKALLGRNDIHMDTTTDLSQRTALMLAARYGHNTTMRILLPHIQHPIELQRTIIGGSILHLAVVSGNLSTVQLVTSITENLMNARDSLSNTPLVVAATIPGDHHEIVRFLQQNNAAIHVLDTNGRTPVHHAALNGNYNVTKVLLEVLSRRPDSSPQTKMVFPSLDTTGLGPSTADQPLFPRLIASPRPFPIAFYDLSGTLLRTGPLINLFNNGGNTPLDSALQTGHHNIADLLRQYGALPASEAAELPHNAWWKVWRSL